MTYKSESAIKIYLLGSFRMEVNGQNISSDKWKSKKALTLFKYLVSKREKVQKDILMDLLWPDSCGEKIHSLHTTVYYLRQILNSLLGSNKFDFIKYSKGLYWFEGNDSCWLDIEEFEFLYNKGVMIQESGKNPKKAIKLFENALSLYQGDFLLDELYEDWTFCLRQHLQEIYIDAVLRISFLFIEVYQDYMQAVHICRHGLEIDPFREELHRTIISYLIKAGMYVEATKEYQKYTRMLHEEFGLSPSPRVKELFLELSDKEIGILEDFSEKRSTPGSFLCDRQTFELIYELQVRRQKRTNETFALMSFVIDDDKGTQQKEIINMLQNFLRQGDVICNWSNKLILLLLYKADLKATRVIKKRFENVFAEKNLTFLNIKFYIVKCSDSYYALEEMII